LTKAEADASLFMPDLVKDFKFSEGEAQTQPDPRCRWIFTGGELAGKTRLQNYLFAN